MESQNTKLTIDELLNMRSQRLQQIRINHDQLAKASERYKNNAHSIQEIQQFIHNICTNELISFCEYRDNLEILKDIQAQQLEIQKEKEELNDRIKDLEIESRILQDLIDAEPKRKVISLEGYRSQRTNLT